MALECYGPGRRYVAGLLCGGSLMRRALPQPEVATASVAKPGWATRTYAVAAANPLATEAGQQMLRAGGAAVDAAIAVQMVLALVEPQSSGLGGGAFLIHFDGKQVQAFDGRETAPAGVTPDELMGKNGQPLGRMQAIVGGRSVGVPGTLRMLELAHRQHGRLPWAALFAPAIRLAQQGFVISPRMASLVAADRHLRKDPVAAAYFYDADGKPWPAGHVLRNPELAEVLQAHCQARCGCLHAGRSGARHRTEGAKPRHQPRQDDGKRLGGLPRRGTRAAVL